jgi:enamine deaminase RidA (YjgF/YER057c/UK114 family)
MNRTRLHLLAAAALALAPAAAAPAAAPAADLPTLLPKPVVGCYLPDEDIGYCEALRVGDTLYVSGHVGKGEMREAVASTYRQLEETLRQHGLGFAHVVKENVYTRDLDAFIAAGDVRKGFYAGAKPAATWVQVDRLFRPEYVLEVELVATIPR